METVGLEYQFEIGKALKNQVELIKNFLNLNKTTETTEKAVKKLKGTISLQSGSKEFIELAKAMGVSNKELEKMIKLNNEKLKQDKQLRDAAKKAGLKPGDISALGKFKSGEKPKEEKTGGGGAGAMAVAGGMAIYNTALGAMSGAMSAMNKNFPAIGQAIENIGDMVSTNFFRPLAKEVLPVIMSIHNWVAKNRIVFVQLGEILAGVFRSAMAIGKTVFNALKGAFNGFMSAFGSGKVTIGKFVNFLTMTGFKIYFVFDELAKMLTPLIESIGIVFGVMWKNSVSPFIDGMSEAFIETVVPAFAELGEAIQVLKDSLSGLGTDAEWVKDTFKFLGKVVLGLAFAPFIIAANVFKMLKTLVGMTSEKFVLLKKDIAAVSDWIGKLSVKFSEIKKEFMNFGGNIFSGAREKVTEFFNWIGDMWQSVKKSLTSSPIDLLDKVFSFGSGIYDKVADVLKGAWASSLNWLIDKMPKISSAFGLEKIEMRAAGGAVTANNPYIVGEKGAELFMPEKSGSIMNNNDLKNLNKPVANNANAMSANSSYIDNRVFNFNIQASSPMEVAKEVQSKVDFGSEMKRWKAKAM